MTLDLVQRFVHLFPQCHHLGDFVSLNVPCTSYLCNTTRLHPRQRVAASVFLIDILLRILKLLTDVTMPNAAVQISNCSFHMRIFVHFLVHLGGYIEYMAKELDLETSCCDAGTSIGNWPTSRYRYFFFIENSA
jgi:hypothetical protein